MKGVKFGGLHSFYEWGLILSEKEIKAPQPKTKAVDVEGADGQLDYTEAFGDVKYQNRQLSFKFSKTNIVPDGFLALFSVVQNALHGKKMQVILDDDPANYYFGRVAINEWKSNKRVGEIVIEVDAEPYKLKVAETVITQAVTDSAEITLTNSRKPVVPTITTTAAMNITFGSFTAAVQQNFVCQGSGTAIWLCTVTSGGVVRFARYRTGDTWSNAAANTWLPIDISFILD